MAEEAKKWKKEVSAGGVVYKNLNGRIFVLMINPKKPSYGPPQDYWTWPKGLVDEGEQMEESALREVKEEAGVEAVITEEMGYVKFFRTSKDFGNALKFVHYWLMEYKSGDPKDHDEEVAEAEWIPLEEAESRLKFPHDKEILERAKKILIT